MECPVACGKVFKRVRDWKDHGEKKHGGRRVRDKEREENEGGEEDRQEERRHSYTQHDIPIPNPHDIIPSRWKTLLIVAWNLGFWKKLPAAQMQ